jgi:putative membrane-bound dehydrogenase-like protein
MVHRSWVDAVRSLALIASEFAMSRRFLSSSIVFLLVVLLGPSLVKADAPNAVAEIGGPIPADARGRPLNLGFETGNLADWTAEGDAFKGQPIEGDAVHRRRGDMHSQHAGNYWVGSFEVGGDEPKGTLTSVPFPVSKPFASFLIGGGSLPGTRVELVRPDTGQVVFRAYGDDREDLERVVADLSPYLGQQIVIRLVDRESGGWGHINFDDFRLHDTKPSVPPRRRPEVLDVFVHAGLGPQEAARAMTVPPGFQVTLFAGEPDVVQPIAMAIDDRGRIWIAEAYSYPRRVPDNQAKDRILIFEDTDNDGRFDTRKVFADHLNLVSGLEVGFGGVWVGAAPKFFFIPDKDGDDRPDGPPQVLLDGWGQHDTHETLNSFTWGPDGWLYGCHGVFTHSRVGKPGTPDSERTPINAGIWRYHPTRHAFEVFAHGTSNPWGIDFDARGQLIITACVIPHLYHMIQGGRYERQGGQHFNPYTYDDIKTIADHRHFPGANPHAANGRSDAAGGGHAHSGAMIYLGGAWPAEYNGSLFMNNIHGARLNRDLLKPSGSGFIGSHAPDFLLANDLWSQIISLKTGPDGSLFMIDWYDKNQCHHNDVNGHDRTNGRIFKVSYGPTKPLKVDLAGASNPALVELQTHPNEWYARHARRVLQERGPKAEVSRLLRNLSQTTPEPAAIQLRILLAMHAVGGLSDPGEIASKLEDPDPTVRAWTIQLATEQGTPVSSTLSRFAELSRTDPSPLVRLYLASASQRLPVGLRWKILAGLVSHAEDAADHNLPLMYWYAAEPLAAVDASRAAGLASSSGIALIRRLMARRIAALGTPESMALLVHELGRAPGSGPRLALLVGIDEALRGRRQVEMPAAWPKVFNRLAADSDPQVRSRAVALALTFGDPAARASLRRVLSDPKSDSALRREALVALLKVKDPPLAPTMLALVADPELGGIALRGLSGYDDPATPKVLIEAYRSLGQTQRRDALNTLAARQGSARALLLAVEAGKLPRGDLTADLVRQIRNLKDPELDVQLGRVWGTVRETTGDRARVIAQYKKLLTSRPSQPPDRSLGRAVFTKVCQQCHTLFGVGGQVGPDLTGSNRADLDYLLSNVLDSSALIGKDYLAHAIATTDGRVLTGIIRAEDKDTITLVTANDTLVLPKSEVAERRASDQSMMPDDLWKPLSEHEVRSLVSYLASPAQVSLPADEREKKKP